MSIEIKKVTNKKDLHTFVTMPWKIYRGKNPVPQWVPPLIIDKKSVFDKKNNPFYNHADMEIFLAYKDGKVSGRIAAIVDRNFIAYQKQNSGFFGFFECIDDQDVANALFTTAEKFVKELGVDSIMGPMNPSTGSSVGMLIDSFDEPPIVEMEYNPEYYQKLTEGFGYAKAKDLRSYKMTVNDLPLSDKFYRVAEITKKRLNLKFRNIKLKNFLNEAENIRKVYNDAWKNNWGFIPWEKDEFEHLAKDLKLILREEFVVAVEIDDEIVGFVIPLPDLNQVLIKMNGRLFPTGIFKLLSGIKKIDILRVAILGVKEKFHNKGIDAVIIKEIYEIGTKMGIKGAELSWILEDNYGLTNLLENWGAYHYRTYRVFEKKLND